MANSLEALQSEKIPVGGTLGILAYGFRSIMMWREARHNYAEELKSKSLKASNK